MKIEVSAIKRLRSLSEDYELLTKNLLLDLEDKEDVEINEQVQSMILNLRSAVIKEFKQKWGLT